MTTDPCLSELICLLYTAASGQEPWAAFLSLYARAVDSSYAGLNVHDLATHRGNLAASVGMDASFERLYNEHYSTTNLWKIRGAPIFRPGKVVLGEEVVSNATLTTSEFYNDYLRPLDLFHSFGGTITLEGSVTSGITSLRSQSAGTYTQAEISLLETLMPHFACALRIHGRLAALEMAFHQVADAIAVVDRNRCILAANRSAQAVLELRDGISVESDRMRFRDHQLAERFDRILKGFRLARCWGFLAPAGGALSVPRPSGNPNWLLQIMPPAITAPRILAPFEKSGAAIIFINTTEPSDGPAGEDLTSLFGLTEAQRKIALDLFTGKETAEIQERLGVTRNTLKTHLRRLFEKMGVSRQTEVVRVLGKLQSGQQNGNRHSCHPGG